MRQLIRVGPGHIQKGKLQDPTSCPVTLGILDSNKGHIRSVSTYGDSIVIRYWEGKTRYLDAPRSLD